MMFAAAAAGTFGLRGDLGDLTIGHVGQTREHVAQIGEWIKASAAVFDQGVDDSAALSGGGLADEEPVFLADGVETEFSHDHIGGRFPRTFSSRVAPDFGRLKTSTGLTAQKTKRMKLAPTNRISFPLQPQPGERASARIFLLALVSFLLGVAATVGWFQLAAKRNAQNSVAPAASQPAGESPVQPMTQVAVSARPAISALPAVTATAIAEVKQAIPDIANVSEADAENTLRATALKEFAAAAKEMDAQVRSAQQQLIQARNGGSAADQQAAMKQLQQIQQAGAEKQQQIADRLQSQIAALKSIKSAP